MQPLRHITASALVLPFDDIDTDQIIPARFLTTTVKEGLGEHLFADFRKRSAEVDRALVHPEGGENRHVLIAGRNFGSGSSREHAPWALVDWGIRVVIARSFADIFKGNALKNGLLPIAVPESFHDELLRRLEADPGLELGVDVERRHLVAGSALAFTFSIDAFAQRCLLEGKDEIDYLLDLEPSISAHEARSTGG